MVSVSGTVGITVSSEEMLSVELLSLSSPGADGRSSGCGDGGFVGVVVGKVLTGLSVKN